MNKHLRNLLDAVRCKTILYSNMAKERGSLHILTCYTMPTLQLLNNLRKKVCSVNDSFKITKEIDRIYMIEAETEDYIRSATYEIEIEKSN